MAFVLREDREVGQQYKNTGPPYYTLKLKHG